MKKTSPLIPFAITFGMGLLLIFFISLIGVDQKAELNKDEDEKDNGSEVTEFDPAEFAQGKCISCHGGDLTGQGSTPGLVGLSLSVDEIKDILENGKNAMPANLVPAPNLDAMAEYIANLGEEGADAGEAKEDDADGKEEGKEEDKEDDTAAVDAGEGEKLAASCIGCHGGDLTGGMGPGLAGTSLSKEDFVDIAVNGTDKGMPSGLMNEADAEVFFEYVSSLK
ncbi:MAG TPA: cytochrome c [Savagea sp.]